MSNNEGNFKLFIVTYSLLLAPEQVTKFILSNNTDKNCKCLQNVLYVQTLELPPKPNLINKIGFCKHLFNFHIVV